MAKRIEFKPAPQGLNDSQGTRERNEQRMRDAPLQHSDALLSLYQLLQQLHDSGTIDLARGTLSAGGKLVEEVSSGLVQPEAIRGIRNFILLSKMMASIDPDLLERMAKVLPTPDQSPPGPQAAKAPSMFSLVRRLFSADGRRGLALGLTAAEALGKASAPQQKS